MAAQTAVVHDAPGAVHRTADDAANLARCGAQGPAVVRTDVDADVTCAACLTIAEREA